MTRFIPFAVAALAALSPLAANAQPAGGYVAVPTAQPAKTSFIARSTVFSWRDGAYVGAASPERARIMCEVVVKEVGALTSFSADGTAFAPADLAKCNARAK
ncbi:MAG: hypothetical protein M3R41_01075 [Pseudomonadota bacterium]|nr:hypothetical protein [Pseudomonadota bacterium]